MSLGVPIPILETRQKERDRYLKHRNEAIKSALAIEDEFYRCFATHQVIRLCKNAKDLRTARSLFAQVSDAHSDAAPAGPIAIDADFLLPPGG